MTDRDTAPCANCGRRFHIDALDAKPSSFPRRPTEYQLHQLQVAGDTGEDFDRLECADCYGPGYDPGNWRAPL